MSGCDCANCSAYERNKHLPEIMAYVGPCLKKKPAPPASPSGGRRVTIIIEDDRPNEKRRYDDSSWPPGR